MSWIYDDGGRAAAGFQGSAGDCVTRAIAIACERDYREVYDALFERGRRQFAGKATGAALTKKATPRDGTYPSVYKPYIAELGWEWVPTMTVGSGCQVYARADELPSGRLILRLSRHLAAMIDGVIHDTHDPSRDGTRCVYGYWKETTCN